MKRKILADVFLNILASFIPLVTLQFILLPLIASDIDEYSYGFLITLVSWMNLSAVTFGNVLNNARLIYNKRYVDLNEEGDFNLLLILFSSINFIIIIIGLWFLAPSFKTINNSIIVFASIFLLIKNYIIVDFRIKLNYKNILMEGIYTTLGYGLGYIVFLVTDYWEFIYLFGSFFSFLFVYFKTDLLKEPLKTTSIFKKTTSQTIILLTSTVLNTLTVYLDKVLLFSLLGGMAVATYYTASILGKTLALVMGPVTGVFLSYLARHNKIENKNVLKIIIGSVFGGIIGYFSVLFISKPVLFFLYPKLAEESMIYIKVTTLIGIVTLISNLLNTILLKFCDMKWQLLINISYIVIYIILALSLLDILGLMGFCIGILIASIIKLITIIIVYYLTNIKKASYFKDTLVTR